MIKNEVVVLVGNVKANPYARSLFYVKRYQTVSINSKQSYELEAKSCLLVCHSLPLLKLQVNCHGRSLNGWRTKLVSR
jgi:hypothetical protein